MLPGTPSQDLRGGRGFGLLSALDRMRALAPPPAPTWRTYCSAAVLTERRVAAAAAILIGAPDVEPAASSQAIEPQFWGAARIKALIVALDLLIAAQAATSASTARRGDHAQIHIDDHYVALGASIWLPQWREANWVVAGQRLPYADLWRSVDERLTILPRRPAFILTISDDPLGRLVADFAMDSAAALAQDKDDPVFVKPPETRVARPPEETAVDLVDVQAAASLAAAKTVRAYLTASDPPAKTRPPDLRGLLSLAAMTLFRL